MRRHRGWDVPREQLLARFPGTRHYPLSYLPEPYPWWVRSLPSWKGPGLRRGKLTNKYNIGWDSLWVGLVERTIHTDCGPKPGCALVVTQAVQDGPERGSHEVG